MTAEAPRPRRPRLNTVREVCQEYIDRTVSAKGGKLGWETIKTRLVNFMADKGDITLDDLIADDLEKWIEEHPAWKSSWTKKNAAGAIKTAFEWALKKGLIGGHPFRGVSYSQGDRIEPMSEKDFRRILSDASPEFRRVLLFLWWTGCRPLELCSLKWSFIDIEKAVAVLREHKTAHSRKDRLPRVIVLSEKAIRLLTWLLDDQSTGEEYVFLNRKGKPWNRYDLTTRLRRARVRMGLPVSVKLYGCRHSFGTRMAVAGVDLKTLSTLMGHASTTMSEHYIHMAQETEHLHENLEKGLAGKKDKPR